MTTRDVPSLLELLERAAHRLGLEMIVRDRARVSTALASMLERERARMPSLDVVGSERAESFAEYLAPRIGQSDVGLDDVIDALPLRDLLIAWACVEGIAAGAALFDSELGPVVRGTAARIAGGSAEDVVQSVYERVLVRGADGGIGIAGYRGQGPLAVWLQVVTSRLALNRVRDDSRRREDEIDEQSLTESVAVLDVELELVRAAYRPAFKSAIERALQELAPRDRNLLRYTLIDGLSLDAIGRLHGIHRATVARWLASTRESLALRTREILWSELRIDESELDSLVRQVRSQLDVSLLRALAEPG